jgi:6-pyruvoyltetrahydropterin/6-carboxytetrahydropterin synthase
MIIRKKFNFEGAHIVRNCTSKRCRENIHGHSYEVEVFIESNTLDNGFMVMDFILLNNTREFIHSFDHSYTLWDKETEEVRNAIKLTNTRIAEIPISPSAEGYALLFYYVIDKIIAAHLFKNGEKNVVLHSIRVHETKSGYAEAFKEDLQLVSFNLQDITFSRGIQDEWKDPKWWINLLNH